jgi:surface protein
MDCVTMVLIQERTNLPLDLVVLIKSFLYEKLTDENFKQAIALWFQNEEECKWRFGHIRFWNTSRVTKMVWVFYQRNNFNEDLSGWNVSNVSDMESRFYLASDFNGDLSQWNVSKVTCMNQMFAGAREFNGDLSRWNVSNVTSLYAMFGGATKFNGDLSQWDVSKVQDMNQMFHGAKQYSADLSQWQLNQRLNIPLDDLFDNDAIFYRGLLRQCYLFGLTNRNIFHPTIDSDVFYRRRWQQFLMTLIIPGLKISVLVVFSVLLFRFLRSDLNRVS